MSAPILRGRALVLRRLAGLLFLSVLAGAVLLTVAIYQKRFADVEMVVLRADRAGNQLTKGADVKVRGVLVGEVRQVQSKGDGAELTLALRPEELARIPRDVTARLLPKTLFGEKFVALQVDGLRADGGPVAQPLQPGDVIGQDRSETAIETQQVLDDLFPLLQALRPQQLSTTLNALSGALRGRGDRIGANLVANDAYLRQINPELPRIQEDIRRLAALTETYETAADDLLGLLDDFSAVSRNLVDQQEELATFLGTTVGSTGTLDAFLRENEQRFIALAEDSLPSLQTYARYAPEYPCLFAGLVEAEQEVERTFGGLQPGLHITLELTQDLNAYQPGDEPRYADDGGPTCRGLPPNPKEIPFPFYRNGQDGYRDDQPVDPRTGVHGSPAPEQPPVVVPHGTGAEPVALLPGDPAADRLRAKAVIGAATLRPYDEVPDIAALLFGPLARGTTVSLTAG